MTEALTIGHLTAQQYMKAGCVLKAETSFIAYITHGLEINNPVNIMYVLYACSTFTRG